MWFTNNGSSFHFYGTQLQIIQEREQQSSKRVSKIDKEKYINLWTQTSIQFTQWTRKNIVDKKIRPYQSSKPIFRQLDKYNTSTDHYETTKD